MSGTEPQPVALLYGRGRLIVHANPPFVVEFGASCLDLPATEALPDWPRRVFDVIHRASEANRPLATSVLESGRPLAAWGKVSGMRRRLTFAPRMDVETGEVYGVAIRLASPE